MSDLDKTAISENRESDTQATKMYCIFARESLAKMNGIRGKIATQAGHAYVHAYLDGAERFPEHGRRYLDSGRAYKITLVVDTVEKLKELEAAYQSRCGVSLVIDAGFTVFKDADGRPCPTVTCLGIGPLPDEHKGDDLKALRPLT